jgi:hypothetical protein
MKDPFAHVTRDEQIGTWLPNTMEYIQWALLDEFDKEVPNWERVCLLINACPNLCSMQLYTDGMLPLHVAIDFNAPLYVIKFLVEKWDSPVLSKI